MVRKNINVCISNRSLCSRTIRSFLAEVCKGLHFRCSDELLWSVTAKMQTVADGRKLRARAETPVAYAKLSRKIFQAIVVLITAGFFVPYLLGADSSVSSNDKKYSELEERDNLTPKESLSLKLLGTVVSNNSRKSIAIIEDTKSQKQSSYRIADEVLGCQIVKILRGQVILLKDGKVLSLSLPEGGELEPIVTISSDERMVNRGALIKKISDLNVLKEQVVPIPYIEAGKIAGFKITKLEGGVLAKAAGLKEGDVVTAVNNQKLNSFQKAFEVYNNVRNQEKVDVQIKRGKEIRELTYYLN